jgi:hypothetical protein
VGMLRLRLYGSKKPGGVVPRYAVLIERVRDRTFLDFTGWTPTAGPSVGPRPPVGWLPKFVGTPAQPALEITALGPAAGIISYLDQAWWLDLDATNFTDDDYCFYFYDLVTDDIVYCYIVPVFAGDDTSLAVRFSRGGISGIGLGGIITGLPGPKDKTQVSLSANIRLGLPKS